MFPYEIQRCDGVFLNDTKGLAFAGHTSSVIESTSTGYVDELDRTLFLRPLFKSLTDSNVKPTFRTGEEGVFFPTNNASNVVK
jgi:hypothetical protein